MVRVVRVVRVVRAEQVLVARSRLWADPQSAQR